MEEISEAEVATVARAICMAYGFDPEERVPDETQHPLSKDRYVPRWILMRSQARTHVAAFKACRALYS